MSVNAVRSLVRPVITLLLAIAIIVLVALGQTIPDQLWGAFLMIIGFWFGSRLKETPPVVPR